MTAVTVPAVPSCPAWWSQTQGPWRTRTTTCCSSGTAQLQHKDRTLRIAIVDPARDHRYQPAWTLVAAGTFAMKDTRRDEALVVPEGVDLIRGSAATLEPEVNTVRTINSKAYGHGHLVMCPGIKQDLDAQPATPITCGGAP